MTRDYMRPIFQPEDGFGKGFKWIFGICMAGFVLMQIPAGGIDSWIQENLWLYIGEFKPWQWLSYMFIHQGAMHFLCNMLTLFFFGNMAESVFGTRAFIRFYLLCGIGGGLAGHLYFWYVDANQSVIGASGALFGVMYACYRFFPDQVVNLFMVFPVKLKYVVLGLGFLSFVMLFEQGSGMAHYAHLGGLVTGFVYFRFGDLFSGWLDSLKMRRERNEQQRKVNLKQEVDQILAKISKEGMGALTAAEKKTLQEASKKFTKT